MKTKKQHGGLRENAGRKNTEKEPFDQRITVMITTTDRKKLESLAKNFSEFFRKVVREKYSEVEVEDL